MLAADQRRQAVGACAPRSGSRPRSGRAPTKPWTGAARPLTAWAPRSESSNRPLTSRRVLSLITTRPGSASACSRAARFGVSPTADAPRRQPAIRSPTTTRPVAIPTRACNANSTRVVS